MTDIDNLRALPLGNAELEKIREYHRETIGVVCMCGESDCAEGRLLATVDEMRSRIDADQPYSTMMARTDSWMGEAVRLRQEKAHWASELEVARKVVGWARQIGKHNTGAAFNAMNQEIAAYDRVMEEQGFRPCSKCEGRGFIRTLVDGERDSEPCSYCRMSGRVMEEQR